MAKTGTILNRIIKNAGILLFAMLLLGAGGRATGDISERVRAFTRPSEYNYVDWTWNALGLKLRQAAAGSANYLSESLRHQTVLEYLMLVWRIQQGDADLTLIYSDPGIEDPQAASSDLRQELQDLHRQLAQVQPLAETILQDQVSAVASDLGLAVGGQPIPPVLYHSTPLPWALIVSPRETIRQATDVSLVPELSVDQHARLEDQVDESLNVSSLVVGIGGVGLYPTMVEETPDLGRLAEVVSHEWVHNFLTLRPLGVSYLSSPELRTMNETTAQIAGREIGRALLEKYYPEMLPEPAPPAPEAATTPPASPVPEPPAFNYYREMGVTRRAVDQLLGEGKVEEAEQYMEGRRQVFWENGYPIRKLNQAWFAFHGAYADQPEGGAAGADPVGVAVRALRAQSPSLANFLKRMSWMSSFEQLQRAVAEGG